MQINSHKNIPSFGSQKIFKVALKSLSDKSKGQPLTAYFSRLDDLDIPYVEKQEKIWQKTKYGKDIIDTFKNMCSFFKRNIPRLTQFYAIERIQPSNADGTINPEKIYGLAQVVEHPNFTEIEYLQSSSKIPNFNEKAKGIGRMLLYGIVKRAQKQHKKYVCLESTADKFYYHCGFQATEVKNNTTTFELHSKNFKKFLEDTEKNYNFSN